MEMPTQHPPNLARGLLGDGLVGRLAEAAEPWLLERLRIVARTPIEQVHLGWGGEAAREVVVSWCTPTSVAAPFVAVAGRLVPARSDRLAGGGWGHHARVGPLDPGTAFTYMVGHAGRVRSRPSRFRTAPIGPAPFTFTASGDPGADRPAAGAPPTFAARRTVELVEALDPAFHLVAGDPSCPGDVPVWDGWFRMIEPSARSRPWMACVDHRPHDQGSMARRTSGTFRYAGLRFVLLDSDDVDDVSTPSRATTGRLQGRWLERTLEHAAADPSVEAIVVVMHRPASTTATASGSARGVRDAWHGLFTEYGVSLVLQDRDHLHERPHPRAGSWEGPTAVETGVTYVSCGSGEPAPAGTTSGLVPASPAVGGDRHPGIVRVAVAPATTDRPTVLSVTHHPADGEGGPVDVATIAGRRTRGGVLAGAVPAIASPAGPRSAP